MAQQKYPNVRNKRFHFWKWLFSSDLTSGEEVDNNNFNKLVPGMASILAIAIFFLKEFVTHKNEKTEIFTEINLTYALQAINALILLFIIGRGLAEKKTKSDRRIEQENYSTINTGLCRKLERQFSRYIKCFFGMTFLLYLVLIAKTYIDNTNQSEAIKNESFASLIEGTKLIEGGCFSIISDSSEGNLTEINAIKNELNFIKNDFLKLFLDDNKDKKTLCYCDSLKSKKDTIEFFQGLKRDVSNIGPYLTKINKTLPKNNLNYSAAINRMYQGYYLLQTTLEKINTNQSLEKMLQILELLFSNLGAVFIIFCFLILYSKTISPDGTESFLTVKYMFGYNNIEDNDESNRNAKFTTNVLRFVFMVFILITVSQIVFEFAFSSRHISDSVFNIFSIISGLSNAMAMCLLIARFESSHFQSTLSVLALLYLYAIIQSFLGFFGVSFLEDQYIVQDVTTIVAFIGKCILYLYILWIYKTDRLMFYFYNKEEDDKQKLPWAIFLEKIEKI